MRGRESNCPAPRLVYHHPASRRARSHAETSRFSVTAFDPTTSRRSSPPPSPPAPPPPPLRRPRTRSPIPPPPPRRRTGTRTRTPSTTRRTPRKSPRETPRSPSPRTPPLAPFFGSLVSTKKTQSRIASTSERVADAVHVPATSAMSWRPSADVIARNACGVRSLTSADVKRAAAAAESDAASRVSRASESREDDRDDDDEGGPVSVSADVPNASSAARTSRGDSGNTSRATEDAGAAPGDAWLSSRPRRRPSRRLARLLASASGARGHHPRAHHLHHRAHRLARDASRHVAEGVSVARGECGGEEIVEGVAVRGFVEVGAHGGGDEGGARVEEYASPRSSPPGEGSSRGRR